MDLRSCGSKWVAKINITVVNIATNLEKLWITTATAIIRSISYSITRSLLAIIFTIQLARSLRNSTHLCHCHGAAFSNKETLFTS